jgi:CRISPR-associated protein Cmr6
MKNIRAVIGEKNPKVASCHPGLWLDKFSRSGKEEVQREEINQVCKLSEIVSKSDGTTILSEARTRRYRTLVALGADKWTFSAQTTGPFTLHLARALVLENAGICLHSVYGFPYIPGSALKGMARGYAETVWFPGQYQAREANDTTPLNSDEERNAIDAWQKIERIFGWAPGTDKEKSWKVKNIPKPEESDAGIGAVVFHEAWPFQWPKLICDIVNNHHSGYYGTDKENVPPPGDWENPVPAYFLAVAPSAEFDFPLSLHAAAVRNPRAEELIKLACLWLLGALEHHGAGAKTNTGYGRFQLSQLPTHYADVRQDSDAVWRKATDKEKGVFREETFTLELVSPAFLAGANQEADDCDLRPATLRGHLRWWWRTMHAEHLRVPTLKKLENAVWGSTDEGGVVQIDVQRAESPDAGGSIPMPGKHMVKDRRNKDILRSDPVFIKRNGIINANDMTDRKTTQGILYLSFGMDEMPTGRPKERKPRQCLLPGVKWKVAITTRDEYPHHSDEKSNKDMLSVPAEIILKQACDSLWLLCRFGGLGSKGRNGFGSLHDIKENTLESVKTTAMDFRKYVINERRQGPLNSPALESMLTPIQVDTPWTNYWFVLDQLGFSYQDYAKGRKHHYGKEALGLPRKIGVSEHDGTRNKAYTKEWDHRKEVVWLGQKHPFLGKREAKNMRDPSPFFFHLDRNLKTGNYTIRVTAFPARLLPDPDTSRKMLNELLEHLDKDLRRRVKLYEQKGRNSPFPPAAADSLPGSHSTYVSPIVDPPRSGDRVEATLLEEKTKKGGWKAQHATTGMSGHIENSNDVPSDKKPGDRIALIVKYVNEQVIAFRYPTDADKQYA